MKAGGKIKFRLLGDTEAPNIGNIPLHYNTSLPFTEEKISCFHKFASRKEMKPWEIEVLFEFYTSTT